MNSGARCVGTICLFAVFATLVFADASAQELSPPLEFLNPEGLRRLEVSDAQAAKLKELATEYGPRIADAEKAAHPTSAQLQAREEAIHSAIAAGKSGAEAKMLIIAAGSLTKDQEVAANEVLRLRDVLYQSAFAILTEAQQEKVETGLPHLGDEYTGFIIIRLAPNIRFELDDNQRLDDVARKLKLDGLTAVLDAFQLHTSYRVLRGAAAKYAPNGNQSAATSNLLRRLGSYWRIDARQQVAQVETIIRRLNELPEVDLAYRELAVGDPTVGATDNPYHLKQGYLDPAPHGIDARFAWTQPNGRGAGIGLVDLEKSWNRNHEDLVGQNPLLVYGDVRPGDHGTDVLGMIISEDNTVGTVGIASSLSYVFLSSYYRTGQPDETVATVICHTLPLMKQGDVLLLEVQTKVTSLPIEIQDMDYDAIRLAVSLGIIVVEAAGNGYYDLDKYKNVFGKQILNRGSPDYRDSGAIMVGASDPKDDHNRANFSNFGSRVDCFGWGRYVTTTGTISGFGDLDNGGGDPNKKYTAKFHGTSSAAPIVAGAAIILQGMAKANSSTLISPDRMRALLANRVTGTPQGLDVPGNIGVMPDLRAIIQTDSVFMPTPPPSRHLQRCAPPWVAPLGVVKGVLKNLWYCWR